MTFEPELVTLLRPFRMAIWLAVIAVSVSSPGMAGPAVTPHSAVYKLSLGDSSNLASVADASGWIDFKWIEGCDGWTIDQRTHLVLTNTQGHEVESGWVLNAWESKDGLSYRFSLKRVQADTTTASSAAIGGRSETSPRIPGCFTYWSRSLLLILLLST